MIAWLASVALADPLVAVVVVDEAAREEGYALQLEDLVLYEALPVAVGEGEEVRIVDPSGVRHALDVAPGEAWEITGPKGEAWMSRIGEEVRTDVLLVRGDDDAVGTLAEALGAEVVVEGEQTWLVGTDILFEAPWVGSEGLEKLAEVGLVRAEPVETPAEPRGSVPPPRPVVVRQAVRAVAPAPVEAPPVAAPVAAAPVAQAPVPVAAAVAVRAPERRAARVVEEPAAPAPEPADRTAVLDPEAYVGLYLCGDGTGLLLDPSGVFLHPHGSGEWYVSAPGVVRMLVDGATWKRAAIETDRRYCRAVW